MASIPCFFRSVHVVYVYNQYKKKCMRRYDCSYFGNKFPTLGECQRTCKKYEAQVSTSSPSGSVQSSQTAGQSVTQEQAESSSSVHVNGTSTQGQQQQRGSTSQQASGQGQISGGQVATQSSGGGGATVTQSAQEKQESDQRGGDG
ncbi:hypothetical protein MRX96_027203 [Rhipicephalus microplus]